MKELKGRPSLALLLFAYGAPILFFTTFALGEIQRVLSDVDSNGLDINLLVIVVLGTIFCAMPLFLLMFEVRITNDSIIGIRCFGGRTRISWADLDRAELFEVTSKNGFKKTLRLTSRKGGNLRFHNLISNFDDLVSAIEFKSPVPMIRHSRLSGPFEKF